MQSFSFYKQKDLYEETLLYEKLEQICSHGE